MNAVVLEARKYLGVKWRHQGRSEEGMDCAGFVAKVATDLDLLHESIPEDYQRHATDEGMVNFCRQQMIEVNLSEAKPGDVAVMKFGATRHVGIFGDYLHGGLSLIHAFAIDHLKVIEHRFSEDWLKHYKAHLLGVFRFKGLE